MAKVVVVAVLLLLVSLSLPQTRPTVMTYAEPGLYPVYHWWSTSEMERIGGHLTSFENQYYKLPTSPAKFGSWMERVLKEDKERIDAWGTEYRLRIWPDSLAVVSAGPDREHQTDDDIQHTLQRLRARLRK